MMVIRVTPIIVLFLILLISTACNAPSAAPTKNMNVVKIESGLTLLHRMQGRWLDVKNDESVIEVNGERFLSIYQDEVMKVHQLEVFEEFPAQCEGNPSPGGLGFFITWGADGSSYCYQLLSLNHGRMHYEALGPVE